MKQKSKEETRLVCTLLTKKSGVADLKHEFSNVTVFSYQLLALSFQEIQKTTNLMIHISIQQRRKSP